MERNDFIAAIMRVGLWTMGNGTGQGLDLDELKKKVAIMDTIEDVIPEEYYLTQNNDPNANFDSLPIHKRKRIVYEVVFYLQGKDLYSQIQRSEVPTRNE